jgi:hypothetical protein
VEVALESTPLHTEKADDADEIYVRLLEWVGYWAETLEVVPPSVAIVGWSRVDEDSRAAAPERQFLGFRAGTTPEGAAMLTRLLTLWLLSRDDRIEQDSSTGAFQEDVAQLVWSMRAKYRLTPARDRKVLPRFCATCKEYAVEAWWASADPLDVVVQCTHCLQPYLAGKPSDILRWITAGDEFRAGCTVCEWVTPGGFTTRDEAMDALAQHTREEHIVPESSGSRSES